MRNPRGFAAGLLLAGIALLATACGGTVNPQGWASPVLNGKTLYYFPAKDRLAAVTLAGNGAPSVSAESWRFPEKAREDQRKLKIDSVYTAPVVDGDVLYFAAYSGKVFAVNTDGTVRWHLADVNGSIVGGPTLGGDLLVFGTTEGRLYAIKKSDGSLAPNWPKGGMRFGNGIWAAPVIRDGTVYVATMKGEVAAIGLADGARRWERSFKATGAVAELQLLDDGLLFVPSLNRHVYILDPGDGSVLVDFRASDWVWTRAASRDGVAFFGDFSGRIYALDISSGQSRWIPYETHARVKSAPAIVDDVLVVADRKPAVHLISLQTGQRVNVVPLEGAGTVRADVLAFASGLQGLQSVDHPGDGKADRALIVTTKGKLFVADPAARTVTEMIQAGAKQ